MAKKGEIAEITVKNMSTSQINAIKKTRGVISLTAETQDSVIGQVRLRMRLENGETLPKILDFLFQENIKLLALKQEEPTLEDAFVELTTGAPGTR